MASTTEFCEFVQPRDQPVIPRIQVGKQRVRSNPHAVIEISDPVQNVVGRFPAGVAETGGYAVADLRYRSCELRPFREDALDRGRARAVQGNGNLLGRRAEGAGEALARLAQPLAQTKASRIEVLDDVSVRVGDRVADPGAADHDRLTLIGHFRDERANPSLAVGIGSLERRDFGLHPRLKLGGPRQRAFDPIPHGREFASDRLRQRREMVAGRGFGLCQAHRNLRDGARRLTQLAQAVRKGRKSEHEEDRAEGRQRQQRRLGPPQRFPESGGNRGPQILVAIESADRSPKHRSDNGEKERGAIGRTGIHGLEDGADRLAVVVGRRRRVKRRFWLRLAGGRGRSRTRAKQRRGLRRRCGRLEHRRRNHRFWCGDGRRGERIVSAENVVVRQVQRALDRRHRRGDRIRRRILLCHCLRLASSASIARRSTNAPTVSPAWPRPGKRTH